ncbi:hypothetical protein C9439_06175 [archaeon SCG-AAA382B04]|nr:hypothetical protein C9439_06175 [archaeon SCG-AAA382B04]
MNSLIQNLEGDKKTTLFGGKGLKRTLDWLDDNFKGYLKINPSEKNGNYYLILKNNEIILSASKIEENFFYGNKIKKEIKKVLEDEDTVIEAYTLDKKELNKIIEKHEESQKSEKTIESFQIKDVTFPEGNFFTKVETTKELRKKLELKKITGFGKSLNKDSAILIEDGEVIGGIYSDKFGTLKRDNSIIDIKQSFPFEIATTTPKKLREPKKSIRFQDSQKFWSTGEFPGGKIQEEKQKIGRFELFVKNQEGQPIEDATVDIRKEGKKVSFGQTTHQGRIEKKLQFDEYKIWVKKDGYEPKGLDIKVDQDTVKKEIELQETENVDLGVQIFSAEQIPIEDAKIEVVRGIDDGVSGKTNKKGIFRNKIAPGIYNILINKSGEKFTSKIKLTEEEVGTEKNFRITIPSNIKKIIKKEQEKRKKEKEEKETFSSYMKKKFGGLKKRLKATGKKVKKTPKILLSKIKWGALFIKNSIIKTYQFIKNSIIKTYQFIKNSIIKTYQFIKKIPIKLIDIIVKIKNSIKKLVMGGK